MFHSFTVSVASALLFLPIASASAGGPPLLCLPVAGASTDNAEATAQRVAAALGKGVDRASLRQNDGQWYLAFHFNRDRVRLAEIDAALKGSPVSVARDQMRLFGDVILEIDVPKESTEKLLADLAAVKHASVAESKREGDTLLVQLTLPAPVTEFRAPAEFGQVAFENQKFQHESATAPAVGSSELPTHETLRKIVEKHDAKLQGVRWNCWGCRALGCVASKEAQTRAAPADVR